MNAIFSIADVTVRLRTKFPLIVSERFRDFEIKEFSKRSPDYVAVFEEVNELPDFPRQEFSCNSGFTVAWDEENGFMRRFTDEPGGNTAYAIGNYDWKRRYIRVQYLPEGIQNINHTDGAFFHVAWEEMMLRKKRMLLHACCVDTSFGGILFSGRSGIGKSTQGDLWCKYENAVLINGDRPVIYRKDGIWMAFGSPYAGSSKCHVNRCTQVSAVVMLQQAEICEIRKLSKTEAFRKVYEQITVSAWEQEYVEIACSLTEQFVSEIPVYELICTPDGNAVELLRKTILSERKY